MFFSDTEICVKLLSVVKYQYSGNKSSCGGRSFHTLSFRLKGDADYCGPELNARVESKDLMYMPADHPYEIRAGEEQLIVFHFELRDAKPFPPACYRPQNALVLQDAFEAAYASWIGQKPGYYQKTMSLFYKVLEEMNRQFDPVYTGTAYRRIRGAIDCLHLRFTEPELSISELCRQCGLSDTQFRKYFRQVYAAAPLQYLNRLRVDYATELLISTDLSVEEIAQMSGFTDAKYFSALFRKYRQYSPSALRRRVMP